MACASGEQHFLGLEMAVSCLDVVTLVGEKLQYLVLYSLLVGAPNEPKVSLATLAPCIPRLTLHVMPVL